MFHDFFENRILNSRVNKTYICLIPKTVRVIKVADFCNISLVSIVYKIIVKVLATRLKTIVLYTVTPNQSVPLFHKRKIMDSVLIAKETAARPFSGT